MTFRDRKHWEVVFGRLLISRWCAGAPCSYNGWGGRHPFRVRILDRRAR